jgi:hypothetical protein
VGNKGKVRSEAFKQNVSLTHKGRQRPPFTAEHRQKLSIAAKNRWAVKNNPTANPTAE